MSNPAAAAGWVKSTDPKSGRVFYANHVTRKTQWEAPEGWVDAPAVAPPLPQQRNSPAQEEEDQQPLPSNWEVMHDPTTGKPFYVDHERKITQWTRPVAEKPMESSLRPASMANSNYNNFKQQQQSNNYNSSSSVSSSSTSLLRSYQQEAAYYSQPVRNTDVDLSDTMPVLDFKVQTVADALRNECPHCDALFSYSKRRHHCRLCELLFCGCSLFGRSFVVSGLPIPFMVLHSLTHSHKYEICCLLPMQSTTVTRMHRWRCLLRHLQQSPLHTAIARTRI